MGIKLPEDNSGKSEKLRIEEIKRDLKINEGDVKKYESNAKFFTEALKLGQEILKTIQKFKDAEMAEIEWAEKNKMEEKKIEKALIDLEKIRTNSNNSLNKLDLQKDHWATIKYMLHSEYELVKDMPRGDERNQMMDRINSMLENLNNFQVVE